MKTAKKIFATAMAMCLMATAPVQAADEAAAPAKDDGRVEISRGKYITGGILGSALGFGIGHGVQGRYSKGWIFTVGEVAGTVILLSALQRCIDTSGTRATLFNSCSSESGALTLGYATILGFRIWEIVDVWIGARPVDSDKVSFMILPDPKAPVAMVSWRF